MVFTPQVASFSLALPSDVWQAGDGLPIRQRVATRTFYRIEAQFLLGEADLARFLADFESGEGIDAALTLDGCKRQAYRAIFEGSVAIEVLAKGQYRAKATLLVDAKADKERDKRLMDAFAVDKKTQSEAFWATGYEGL